MVYTHNTGQQNDALHAALQERLTALQAEMAKFENSSSSSSSREYRSVYLSFYGGDTARSDALRVHWCVVSVTTAAATAVASGGRLLLYEVVVECVCAVRGTVCDRSRY
eukprot:16732-Heterococcus_DN1.PRE.2